MTEQVEVKLMVPLDSVEPAEDNLRVHTEVDIAAIKESYTRFGQMKPIVVHHKKVIDGNGQLRAATELGWSEIWITRCPDEWTSDTAQAYAIAVNRTAELSYWDQGALAVTLEQLRDQSTFDVEALGFDSNYLDNLLKSLPGSMSPTKEINMDDLDKELKHECPKCGFQFND